MHIRALNPQSIWSNQTATLNSNSALSAYIANANTGADPSSEPSANGGGLFGNLISTLLLQQRTANNGTDTTGQTTENLQGFLQSLLEELAPANSAPASGTGSTGSAVGFSRTLGNSSLEGRVQSLIEALGSGGTSAAQVSNLSTSFNQLMNGLGNADYAPVSSQGSSLSLQNVLQGMLRNIQKQGPPSSAIGQIIDTYA